MFKDKDFSNSIQFISHPSTEELEKFFKDVAKEVEEIDPVHPDHYKRGGMEVIDVWKAFLSPEEYRGALLANLLKYFLRGGYKDCRLVDYKKGLYYAEKLVEFSEEYKDD